MKVFVQVIDTRTGVYQTGMIEENVIEGKEIENALLHFGVSDIKWKPVNQIENASNGCDIKIFYPTGLKPTRKNVLDKKAVGIYSGGVNYFPFYPINKNVDAIDTLLQSIAPYEQSRVEKIRARLESRLAELTGVDYDKNRLEQELIYYIEKLDISEEKQRLTNHLRYFRETMAQDPGQGKKLGFIAQEMGREINTTGSKSNQAEMQNIVVHMKDELEQIKEQVLNVM